MNEGFLAEEISMLKDLGRMAAEFLVRYSFEVLGGILVLAAGFIAARILSNILHGFLERHKVDVTVNKFITGTVRVLVIMFAGLIALGKFGVTIAPFIAGLSVVGFGTSFALQGPLSNYAAGATLIFTKPFKVGDIIEVAGVVGEVLDITLPRTVIRTVDGTTIVVPNKHIIGEIIQNYSEWKKVDIKVGISYDADVDKAIDLIRRVITDDERISRQPTPKVGIAEFGDSSVNLYSRVWCKQADYWDVLFQTNRNIFAAFKREGVTIPFPQRDVHLYREG